MNTRQITITYAASGGTVSDFALEDVYHNLVASGGIWECSTENLFNCLRLGVARGTVAPERVLFRFKGQDIQIGRDGDFSPCPEGFLSLSAIMAREIMMKGAEVRIAERRQDDEV